MLNNLYRSTGTLEPISPFPACPWTTGTLSSRMMEILQPIFYNGLILGALLCSRASDYGLMKIDDEGRVLYFNEKPKGAELTSMVSSKPSIQHSSIDIRKFG